MNLNELLELIEGGEGFHVEFKRKVPSPRKIAKSLIAFANTKGGCILFGVDDDGSIVGVESEKEEIELVRTSGEQFCSPPIAVTADIISYRGKDVIAATVAESRSKPHFFVDDGNKGEPPRAYIRVNDKSVIASREVVRILKDEDPDAPPLRLSVGENERRLFAYFDDHEQITLREFAHLVNISERRASRILVQLVRAGVLRIHTLEKEDFYTLAKEPGETDLPQR